MCQNCREVAGGDGPIWLMDPGLSWSRRRTYMSQRGSCVKFTMADKKFTEEVIKAHNAYRKTHQASDLEHSKDLSEHAQKWADHLVASNGFQHSDCMVKGERVGENIAMKWSSQPDNYTGQEVTDQWYSEVQQYQFGGEPSSNSAGHFTQVVWKDSKKVGVGKAQTADGKVIVVANYRPAGNMMGSYGKNVLPPKSGKITIPVSRDDSKPDSFSSRFGGSNPQGGSDAVSKSTKTRTIREGNVTRTIVEETITKADGSKVTTTKETTTTDGDSGITRSMGRLDVGGADRFDNRSSPSSASSSAGKPQRMSEFIDDCLKAHNDRRKKHGVGALKHAKDLSEYAQKWAEELASTNGFQHSPCTHKGGRIGENIACKWSSGGGDYTGEEVSEQWYSEISKHDFRCEPKSMGSGHFTQMVWKGTTELGVGKAKTSGGKVIVVANYRPAGNMVGTYTANVFAPK
ncbi:hypothetical protein ScPMuIL_011470 [Solemya velum]